ncbi:MAG TPA: ATP-grasp domain-containing protein [Pyrinomonadaceae bacterium]|nr:ATP-grasp domain-containing protein [Pyrinomonadaceae bacterium]
MTQSPQSSERPLNILCLASYFKGGDFIRECKRLGCHVILVTKEKMLKEDWPRDSVDELIAVPNDADVPLFIDLAAFISRKRKLDLVVALEEFDVMTAALIREHLCLPGMSSSTAKTFRDKYRMAEAAKAARVVVPEFVPLINPDDIREFMERVPAPWIIKPRSDVSAIGIRKVDEPEQVWRAVDELNEREHLRERASYYLLAQFVRGEVFHVDSLVANSRVLFAGANRYGRPPLEVAHGGGAYISRTIAHRSEDEKKLFEINRQLVKAFGLLRGAGHAEFIKSDADGKFYFLEMASRVGGAYIAEVLEAASGLNLWREWARIEVGGAKAARAKPSRNEYAGIILSLAKQEFPDTTAYKEPEIVYRVKKLHHAGLIVRSRQLERVEDLLGQYAGRFADDFVAVVPPLEKAE